MIDNRIFYHIYSATMGGCELTKEAEAEARRTWACIGCNSPKPGIGAIDVVVNSSPGREQLNSVVGWGVPIASKAFLTALDLDVVQRDLLFGKVFTPQGKELNNWVTFRGKHRLIVRGTKHARTRKCLECGRDVYFALDHTFLYPSPPRAVSLFESDLCGIVMTAGAFEQSGIEKMRGIWIEKLSVAEVPYDSLGEIVYV